MENLWQSCKVGFCEIVDLELEGSGQLYVFFPMFSSIVVKQEGYLPLEGLVG